MSARPPAVVLGAGIAGLVAAHEVARVGRDAQVYEASPRLAGMAGTHTDPDGFSYDIGAHFVTNRFLAALGMGAGARVLARYGEVVHLPSGRHPRYPLGLLGVGRYVRSAVREKVAPPARDLRTAADRVRHDYGAALADEVAIPLLEMWSGLPADRLAASVIDKIPTSLAWTVWLRAAQKLTHRAVMIGYCKEEPSRTGVFHVHPDGGTAAICAGLAARLDRPVLVDHRAESIEVFDGRVVGARIAGADIETDTVLSTLPLNRLPGLVRGADHLSRFERFGFRGLLLVNLKLPGRDLLPDVVVWTPQGFPFFRVTEAPMAMPWLAPDGRTMVLCEIGAQPGDAWWTLDDDTIARRCAEALEPLVPGAADRLLGASVLRQPLGYPVFALDHEDDRATFVRDGTGVEGLFSLGRNGEFDHILMEDSFWRIRRRASELAGLETDPRRRDLALR